MQFGRYAKRVGVAALFVSLFTGIRCTSYKLYPLLDFVPRSAGLKAATVERKTLSAKEIRYITEKLGSTFLTPESADAIRVSLDGLSVTPLLVVRWHNGILNAFIVVDNQSQQTHKIILDSAVLENQTEASSKVFSHAAIWADVDSGEEVQVDFNTLHRSRLIGAKKPPYAVAPRKTVLLKYSFDKSTADRSSVVFTIKSGDTGEALVYGFHIGDPVNKNYMPKNDKRSDNI